GDSSRVTVPASDSPVRSPGAAVSGDAGDGQNPRWLDHESVCRRAVRRASRPLRPERPGRQLLDRQPRQAARTGRPAATSILFQEAEGDEPRQSDALCTAVLRLHVRVQRVAVYLTIRNAPGLKSPPVRLTLLGLCSVLEMASCLGSPAHEL